MNRRTCPDCGGRSYSSYNGPNWECPYCGKDLGDIMNEFSDFLEKSQEEETPISKLYAINGGKSERKKQV